MLVVNCIVVCLLEIVFFNNQSEHLQPHNSTKRRAKLLPWKQKGHNKNQPLKRQRNNNNQPFLIIVTTNNNKTTLGTTTTTKNNIDQQTTNKQPIKQQQEQQQPTNKHHNNNNNNNNNTKHFYSTPRKHCEAKLWAGLGGVLLTIVDSFSIVWCLTLDNKQ